MFYTSPDGFWSLNSNSFIVVLLNIYVIWIHIVFIGRVHRKKEYLQSLKSQIRENGFGNNVQLTEDIWFPWTILSSKIVRNKATII